MNTHDDLQLRDKETVPTNEMLEQILGSSYIAYETFQDILTNMEMEQEWQWYTPYKVWFAKGQYSWKTKRGTKKEKTLFWLHFFEGHFSIVVWFKEKNRMELTNANVSNETRRLIDEADTMGKMPTFPVNFDITSVESLTDVYTLIECKKKLEL